MIKNQQQFNIKLRPGSSDIVVFPVPSLDSIKKINTNLYLDDKTKRQLQDDASKEAARPYVIADVASGVNEGLPEGSEDYLKIGDLVFCNPDSMGAATVIRLSTTTFWKNPIIIPAFYAYKVADPTEYEKDFDAVIDWYNEEQAKKEAILEKVEESKPIKLLMDTDIDKVVLGFEYRMYSAETEKWELYVVSEEDLLTPSFKLRMEININSRRVAFK